MTPLVQQMRKDILNALNIYQKTFYSTTREIPKNRQEDILQIKRILRENDPLQVRASLLNYIHTLASGFITLFPFLAVNQLKYAVKNILDLPKYQEIEILKALLQEKSNDKYLSDPSTAEDFQYRLNRIETQAEHQAQRIKKLDQEIERITKENQFLYATIQILSEKNQQLNEQLSHTETKLQKTTKAYEDLSQKYQGLLIENNKLHQQLNLLQKNSNNESLSIKPKVSYDVHIAQVKMTEQLADNQFLKRRQGIV